MKKRMSIDEVNEKAHRFSLEMFGIPLPKPFELSTRFTRTHGQCTTKKDKNGKMQLIKLLIASYMLNGDYEENDIDDLIKHELLHWYTNITENAYCGHNEKYKRNCKKHGVESQSSKHIYKIGETKIEKTVNKKQLGENEYHEVICHNCNRVLYKSKSISKLRHAMRELRACCPDCGSSCVYSLHDNQGLYTDRYAKRTMSNSKKEKLEKDGIIFVK